jgi:uncharacterized protein (DUF433 family)
MIERIVFDPRILGGKPVIKGTRLSVEFILGLLSSGVPEGEILEDYPYLSKTGIQACLNYRPKSGGERLLSLP